MSGIMVDEETRMVIWGKGMVIITNNPRLDH